MSGDLCACGHGRDLHSEILGCEATEEHDSLRLTCPCLDFKPPAAPRRETIGGIPFEQVGVGQDTVRCCLDGQVVDVGGELKEHLAFHESAQLEDV